MKQLIAIVLMMCYSASAGSMVFSLNFCNEVFSYVSLDTSEETECCCSKEKNKDCCDKEVVVTKKANEHQRCFTYTVSALSDAQIISPLIHFQSYRSNIASTPAKLPEYYLRPPPLLGITPFYILHSVYRI